MRWVRDLLTVVSVLFDLFSSAITPDGLLSQSRDQQGWHGSRCTKGVVGKGKLANSQSDYIANRYVYNK